MKIEKLLARDKHGKIDWFLLGMASKTSPRKSARKRRTRKT